MTTKELAEKLLTDAVNRGLFDPAPGVQATPMSAAAMEGLAQGALDIAQVFEAAAAARRVT